MISVMVYEIILKYWKSIFFLYYDLVIIVLYEKLILYTYILNYTCMFYFVIYNDKFDIVMQLATCRETKYIMLFIYKIFVSFILNNDTIRLYIATYIYDII